MENKLDLCQQCPPAAAAPTSHGIALASGQQVQGCGHSPQPGSGEAASAIPCAVFKHTHSIVWEMLTHGRGSNTAPGSAGACAVWGDEMGIRLVRLGNLIAEVLLQGRKKNSNTSKLFLQVHSERTRGNGLMLPTSKTLSQQREHLIYHESPAALGQAAQGCCRISILGISRIDVDKTL